MKRFFDLGYHRGEGLAWFRDRYLIDASWQVCCFEPNPSNLDAFESGPNIINFAAAAWVHDGSIQLHRHESGSGRRDGEASSVMATSSSRMLMPKVLPQRLWRRGSMESL